MPSFRFQERTMHLTRRQQLNIGLILALIMAFTRSHHWATLHALPDASWAIFFLVGVTAPIVDRTRAGCRRDGHRLCRHHPIRRIGLCVSPRLLAAGTCLRRTVRRRAHLCRASQHASHRPALAGRHGLGGAVIAELFSSGGFYFFSGRVANPTLVAFVPNFFEYFPAMLSSFALYLGLAMIAHLLTAPVQEKTAA
jgi:hypothetical protein